MLHLCTKCAPWKLYLSRSVCNKLTGAVLGRTHPLPMIRSTSRNCRFNKQSSSLEDIGRIETDRYNAVRASLPQATGDDVLLVERALKERFPAKVEDSYLVQPQEELRELRQR